MVQINLVQTFIGAAQKFIQRKTAYNSYDAWYPIPMRTQTPKQKVNIDTLRRLAKTPIARSAINQIKDGVKQLPWHFVPIDGKKHAKEIAMLTRIMNHPNYADNYGSFITQELEDMLVADMGCFEKRQIRSAYQPLYLFPIDANTIQVVQEWDGNPKTPRYAQNVHGKQEFFLDSEIAVMTKNNNTHSLFGMSPTETAWKHIQYLMDCQAYANDIASNAMPKYLVSLGKSAGEGELAKLRAYITNEVQGQSTLAIFGAEKLDVAQSSPIGDDAACLNWQKMLLQIISVCYRVPPERLGSAISNDRSTVADQEEDFTENTIKPWARVVEDAINRHVVELLGLDSKVKFEFIYLPSQAQKTVLKDTVTTLVANDVITLNEARRAIKGVLPIDLPDLPDGDVRASELKSKMAPQPLVTEPGKPQSQPDSKGGENNGQQKDSQV